MRVAVLAGSIRAGIRIAQEIECVPGIDVFIVSCKVGLTPPILRWARELFLALKSFEWRTLAAKAWNYARSGKLIILRQPLDHAMSIARLRSLRCDVGLHAAGVIYRQATISAFRLGILNAHIGILPKYRGRSVVEWSVLQGDPTGVTVFFIDSGIDTGERIVLRELIPSDVRNNALALKNMLFGCDARLYRKAVEALQQPGVRFESNDISKGKRYYVMSKTFTQVVNEILKKGAAPVPGEIITPKSGAALGNASTEEEMDPVALKKQHLLTEGTCAACYHAPNSTTRTGSAPQ